MNQQKTNVKITSIAFIISVESARCSNLLALWVNACIDFAFFMAACGVMFGKYK